MKTNSTNDIVLGKELTHTNTNELDEILEKVFKDYRIQHKSGEYYETDIIHTDLTPQINKWAEKKCLRVIGENMKKLVISEVDIAGFVNQILEEQRKNARKEFYE